MGNVIQSISGEPIAAAGGTELMRIDGGGRAPMSVLIHAHTHIMFETLTQEAVPIAELVFVTVAAVKGANDMRVRGPRIWPSGAKLSQTGGHRDVRLPNELPAAPDRFHFSECIGAAAIADDADTVRRRAREQVPPGASQLERMAGGGVGSSCDSLDVAQYTVPELRAAVELGR